jgi:carboxyl-terminal processing protease
MNTIKTPFLIIMLVLSFGIGYDMGSSTSDGIYIEDLETNVDLDLAHYENVWDTVLDRYLNVNEIQSDSIIDGSIKGMVKALNDPYSSYMNAEETKMFMSDLDSELEGIGAVLGMSDKGVIVETPLKGSPAEASGIQTGDIIVEVDNEDIQGLGLLEVVKLIRGEKGTTVTLGIIRENETGLIETKITRDKITLDSVTYEKLDNLFYISINQFSDDTLKEFQNATTEALLSGAEGIVLDLRFNGGGYLESAVHILGEFLDNESAAVQMVGKTPEYTKTIFTSGPSRLSDVPVAVLINQASASAAEIVAGSLQDFGRAVVIGETSYGKGTIQDVVPFGDGSTLRITIAKWLTAKGQDIDGNGIVPDVEVQITDKDIANEFDSQLDAAKQALRNKLSASI